MNDILKLKPWPLLSVLLLLCIVVSPLRAQFSFDECSTTEAWLPVGKGISGHAVASAVWNDLLYVVHRANDTTFTLSTWNGADWDDISTFVMPVSIVQEQRVVGDIADMKVYNNELYISGPFRAVNSLPGTDGIAAWNGTAWHAVPGNQLTTGTFFGTARGGFELARDWVHRAAMACRMLVYKGELLVSCAIDPLGDGESRRAITVWNGASWRTLVAAPDLPMDSAYVTSMVEWHGDLYVGGFIRRFITFDGVEAIGVMRWDGTTWSQVGPDTMRSVRDLFIYRGDLYAVKGYWRGQNNDESPSLHRWDGERWLRIDIPLLDEMQRRGPNPAFLLYNDAIAVYNDAIYLFVDKAYMRGDNNEDHTNIAIRWDGTAGHRVAMPDSTVRFMIPYNGELIAGGSFSRSCGLPLSHMARLCPSGSCVGISGRLLLDAAGDCDNPGEKPGVADRFIEITPGPHYAVTDSTGYYRAIVEPGSYTVAVVPYRHWVQTCPVDPATRSVTIVRAEDSSAGNNFAVVPTPNVRDIRLSLLGGGLARVGGIYPYTFTCTNVGTVPVSACMVRLHPHPAMTFSSATIAPASGALPDLEWSLDLAVGESQTITAWFAISTAVELGDTLCASVDADDDITPYDNHDSDCVMVRAPFDPNDISVVPAGSGSSGVIAHGDSVLTYRVRFQNIGSDTAFRVVVIDTLSEHLDLTTLVLGASSHPFRLHVAPGNALIWDFSGIRLPSKRSDIMGSQGYFKYSVRLRRGLAPRTQIPNRASIYFDYNTSVITNRVLSTIPAPLVGVDVEPDAAESVLAVYPNPAHGALYLRGDLLPGGTIELRNILGELLRTARCEGSGDAAIDLEGVSSGSYLVTAPMRGGGMTTRRVTVIR